MDELNLSTAAAQANVSEIQARAQALGLVVTSRCRHCGAPLWDERSLTAGAGPICRRRHENDPGANSAKNITRAA